jgi:hypothetical protein
MAFRRCLRLILKTNKARHRVSVFKDHPVKRLFPLVLITVWLSWPHSATAQQPAPGAICVATFADADLNGLRAPAEAPLAGVNINLATSGVIIATHITDPGETEYCFERLLPGIYTITFTDNPTYTATTANQGTFELEAGNRLTVNDFGAAPVPIASLRQAVAEQVAADSASKDEPPLDETTRLLLSTVGSMMVMLFMVGVGAVILGMVSSRRARQKEADALGLFPLPDEIKPPNR